MFASHRYRPYRPCLPATTLFDFPASLSCFSGSAVSGEDDQRKRTRHAVVCQNGREDRREGRSRNKLIPPHNSHSLVRLRKLKPRSLSGNNPLFVSQGVTGEYGDGAPGGETPVTRPHLSRLTPSPTHPLALGAWVGRQRVKGCAGGHGLSSNA
ncbi:hypothetical protein E2C01_025622 [Portunus trituberculatus]|uniref:Uncharacterized protein n=1 Tax=Portunus trituberculatus TaxID=210409 RepID=A0A5B7EDU4_PORTR|nr:hypothetical protein [Portunus trituberculatus]